MPLPLSFGSMVGRAFKDADDSTRPIKSITTLQPLPTIDPKDKGSEEDKKRVGSRKKRAAGLSSKQKSPKKQKVNDQESINSDKELRICLKVVPEDDKAINYETLDVKSLIVDYESQKLRTIEADEEMVPFIKDLGIDDDSFSIDDIDCVEASPSDSELVGLEEVEDDILREILLNIYLLIVKIESLNDNPTPDRVLMSPSLFRIPVKDSNSFFENSDTSLSYSDNSLLEFETFSDHTEETSSGSTTTHADDSLPEYDLFLFKIEPDQGELTSVVMEDILGEPHVHVPNVLPTHPSLMLDSDFIPSDDSFRSDLEVSFPSGTRNKIFDPGVFYYGIHFLSHLSVIFFFQ
nr:hypothetical protein [Tanacetum cinerariifolium]